MNGTDNVPSFEGAVTIAYDLQSSVSEWIPLGTVTVPAGGTTAQLAWIGLEKASHYEWRAEAFDGINRSVSAASRFATADAFAPTIALKTPLAGVDYTAPATITMKAEVADADGSINHVDFFIGTTKVGQDTTAPYEITAPAQVAGTYDFSAVAVDNDKRASLSAIVNVQVINRVNALPSVSLTAPVAGGSFEVPGAIALAANAEDGDGAVAKVLFYANGSLVGEDDSAPFSVNWSDASPGDYSLTAVAYDNDNATTTSVAVPVSVRFSNAGAQLDVDGDSIPALAEYALDTPANSPNRAGLPVLGSTGGKLTLSFLRARSGIVYTVQASDDLKSWTDLVSNPGAVGETVTVTDDNTTSPNRFLRLRIEAEGHVVTLVPAGRMTHTLPKGRETAVNFPLSDFSGAIDGQPAGFITSVEMDTLENTNAGWTPGHLSQPQIPYLLRITSGLAAGRTFAIATASASQNSATRVTLETRGLDLTTLGIVPGADTYEIIPADTLGSLFPTGALLSGNVSTADTLRLWDGAAWITYFHDGAAWQQQGGGNADNLVVMPHQGWQLLRRGSSTSVVVLGQVSSTPANVAVARGGSSYIALLPVQQTFADFPLQTLLPNWTSNSANPTAGDHVRLWSGAAWLNYYYDGGVWKRQGSPANAGSTVLLKPGRPILIVRPAGSGSDSLLHNKTY